MSLFSLAAREKHVEIKCPAHLTAAAAEEFHTLSQAWIEKAEHSLYVLDFAEVKVADASAFRPFVLLFQGLKNQGKFLFTINASADIAAMIHSGGLESALNLKTSLTEALSSAGIKVSGKPAIDVHFINPFITATQMTLEMQANTKVKIGKPVLKAGTEPREVAIAGVISLTSAAFHGSIALCFPAKVFLAIYSNMLGEKHEVITKEIEDAAGEILNIIFGQAKAQLNDKDGYQIQKAIPTIVRGNGLEVHHLTRVVAVILPFETEAGPFHIEISTEMN